MTRQVEIIGPEPVSEAEAKAQVFYTGTDPQVLSRINLLIEAAREYAEANAWRSIIPAKYVLSLDEFPEMITLPRPPAYQVDKIEYIDAAGQLLELNPHLYQVDIHSEPARIKPVHGKSWPSTRPGTFNAVTISYRAGYLGEIDVEGTPVPVNTAPKKIKEAILLMIKHWFDNPEAVVVGVGASTSVNEVPLSASSLLELESARFFV